MEQGLVRTCISLPEALLSQFDKVTQKRGYSSRSEGMRDAIRNTIVHYEWMNQVDGKRLGVISLVYEHHQRGLSENLARIQHERADLIISSVHIHLDPVSYTHLRAHETDSYLVCRLLLENKKDNYNAN